MFSQDRVIRKRRTMRLLNRVWIIKPDRIFSRVKLVKCTSPDDCSCGEVKLRAEGVAPPPPPTQKEWRCLATDARFDIAVLGRCFFGEVSSSARNEISSLRRRQIVEKGGKSGWHDRYEGCSETRNSSSSRRRSRSRSAGAALEYCAATNKVRSTAR